jgi:hypothetical protein
VKAFPADAFLAETCPAGAFLVETCPVEACPVETCPAEACLVEAFLVEACLVGENKGSFLVEAVAYAFQGKVVAAASVRADNIECRRVVVALVTCRAWVSVDPDAEVPVRGAGGWNFAVAVASAAVASAAVSGARDKAASED